MNPLGQKPILEFAGKGSSSSGEPSMAVPKPMEGLQGISTPPFLTKTYDLVNDPTTNHIVSWSIGNNSFIVWDPETFATQILPTYFKHSNLSSFIRQLNTYGFKKVDPDKLEFAHERFLRGQRQLLKEIKRRKPPVYPQSSHQDFDPCVELGQFGPESEIDRLRRDKQVLMVELVKLRQEQQNTKAHLREIEHRLKATEMKQKQITGFMAKLIQNPRFIEQLVHQEKMKEFVDAFSNKRRRTIDQVGEGETSGRQETQGYGDSKRLKVLDQGETSKGKEVKQEGGHKSLDKGFWEDLLNDQIDDDMGLLGNEVEGEEVD